MEICRKKFSYSSSLVKAILAAHFTVCLRVWDFYSVYKISAMQSIPDMTQENKTQRKIISALPIRIPLSLFLRTKFQIHILERYSQHPIKLRLKRILHLPQIFTNCKQYARVRNQVQRLKVLAGKWKREERGILMHVSFQILGSSCCA